MNLASGINGQLPRRPENRPAATVNGDSLVELNMAIGYRILFENRAAEDLSDRMPVIGPALGARYVAFVKDPRYRIVGIAIPVGTCVIGIDTSLVGMIERSRVESSNFFIASVCLPVISWFQDGVSVAWTWSNVLKTACWQGSSVFGFSGR